MGAHRIGSSENTRIQLSGKQHLDPEQINLGPAIHQAFDGLDFVVATLGEATVPVVYHGVFDGGKVVIKAAGEGTDGFACVFFITRSAPR